MRRRNSPEWKESPKICNNKNNGTNVNFSRMSPGSKLISVQIFIVRPVLESHRIASSYFVMRKSFKLTFITRFEWLFSLQTRAKNLANWTQIDPAMTCSVRFFVPSEKMRAMRQQVIINCSPSLFNVTRSSFIRSSFFIRAHRRRRVMMERFFSCGCRRLHRCFDKHFNSFSFLFASLFVFSSVFCCSMPFINYIENQQLSGRRFIYGIYFCWLVRVRHTHCRSRTRFRRFWLRVD